jgi:hypothetical protein
MSRTILDADFLNWEVFASAGDLGFSEHPQIVFNCISNRWLRPRAVEVEGDSADAEKLVVERSDAELLKLFQEARPLN